MESQSPFDTRYNFEKYGNLSWVRTAAQAALALKLHGILETTGYQSMSAKLQHASLPKIAKIDTLSIRDDERTHETKVVQQKEKVDQTEDDFEKGIVCVESNLEEERHFGANEHGYDMLPSPLPLTERSALCAGSQLPKVISEDATLKQNYIGDSNDSINSGVRYGENCSNAGACDIVLGDVSVDRDIDRLRDMIRTVDGGLSRCLSAGLCVGTESCDKLGIQVELLKELDSGEGWCRKMISQKALLSGVEVLERIQHAAVSSAESFVSGKS